MFKSPISFMFDQSLNDILKEVVKNSDDLILEAVKNVGIHVDKEKLIHVLEDARFYYDDGFKDGKEVGYKNGYKVGYEDGFHTGLCEGENNITDKILNVLEKRIDNNE